MLRIITLLQQKNHYLEKFYTANETEMLNFVRGDFEGLETFYQTRERILEMIKYIDDQIENEPGPETGPLSAESKKNLRENLAVKDEFVSRILAQDLEILACIESAKSNIIRELQDLGKNRRTVGKFKSPTFTTRFDEKA